MTQIGKQRHIKGKIDLAFKISLIDVARSLAATKDHPRKIQAVINLSSAVYKSDSRTEPVPKQIKCKYIRKLAR